MTHKTVKSVAMVGKNKCAPVSTVMRWTWLDPHLIDEESVLGQKEYPWVLVYSKSCYGKGKEIPLYGHKNLLLPWLKYEQPNQETINNY